MPDNSCPCCGGDIESNTTAESAPDQWQINDSVLTTELPEELRLALGRFIGTESIDTLGGWVAAVRYYIDGDSVTIDELCVTDNETEHWGSVDGERYYFACFYDAVLLAALIDGPVDIRTKSPDGTVIEARAVGSDELTVTPTDAVFSFGIDSTVEPPNDDGLSLERGYAAICPYVKAFPSRDVYERWAETVSAATVAMPLEGATELAEALVT